MSYQPRCVHLNCKSMQVWGDDFENDPEYQAGMVEFWCTETFKNIGPDGSGVSLPECSLTERSCFQEYLDFSKGPRPIEGVAPLPPEKKEGVKKSELRTRREFLQE